MAWSNLTKNTATWVNRGITRNPHYLLREQGDHILREQGDSLLVENLKPDYSALAKNTASWSNLAKN